MQVRPDLFDKKKFELENKKYILVVSKEEEAVEGESTLEHDVQELSSNFESSIRNLQQQNRELFAIMQNIEDKMDTMTGANNKPGCSSGHGHGHGHGHKK